MRDTHPSFFSRVMPFLGLLIAATVAPAGHVALASPEETAAQPVPVSTAQGPAGRTGLQVYNEVCIACHAAPGIGGAPALGDDEAWAARMTQGADALIDHALNGFSGSAGIMPRKGGRLDLSDAEIIAAVEYMVEQSAP